MQEVAIKMVDKKQMNATGMAGRVRQEVRLINYLTFYIVCRGSLQLF
jgi:hypothetical protein